MDERLRQELAAWLEFYRELGIEDFYRRPLGGTSSANIGPENPPGAVVTGKSEAQQPTQSLAIPKTLPGTAKFVVDRPAEQASRRAVALPQMSISPPSQSLSLFDTPPSREPRRERETLEQIREDLGDCHRCRLSEGRKTIVFGQGNPRAELVFVGEAPGADEDEQGLPFVGRAGQLLNRMIQFIGMKREQVYISNIVKCRPPGNRTPERDEVEPCSPFLFRQIEAIQPRLICCLGAPAVRTILGIKEGITKIRGQFYDYRRARVLVTFHPAYILRNPREEKFLREDFEKIRDFLKLAR